MISGTSEQRPTFMARKNPGSGWGVDILWPDGETEVIKVFITEHDAAKWPLPEVPPRHSMTSSAVASSDGGTERPRVLAVFRLMTSLKRVGCSMGRSPGFAPLSTLST